MLPEIWTNTLFMTNTGESAHANINRNGYGLSLLAAIQNQKSSKKTQIVKNNMVISHEPSEMIAISRKSFEMSIDDYKKILRIEREKLNIQRDKNNELEREIMLQEKLQKLTNNN
ncbi:9987_t:CDS:2 [Gigaspora margarita]|uniref:9987_t:CDS:1 n=1 Tax=Gigaspora margarita TaxID=4874 RepID=A0ABN7WRB2_GIGMA|nr:9987_t:CDS:2 [Gigaspora margarita]